MNQTVSSDVCIGRFERVNITQDGDDGWRVEKVKFPVKLNFKYGMVILII